MTSLFISGIIIFIHFFNYIEISSCMNSNEQRKGNLRVSSSGLIEYFPGNAGHSEYSAFTPRYGASSGMNSEDKRKGGIRVDNSGLIEFFPGNAGHSEEYSPFTPRYGALSGMKSKDKKKDGKRVDNSGLNEFHTGHAKHSGGPSLPAPSFGYPFVGEHLHPASGLGHPFSYENPAPTPRTRNNYVSEQATYQTYAQNGHTNLEPPIHHDHLIHNPGWPSPMTGHSFQQYNQNPKYIESSSPAAGLVNVKTHGNHPTTPQLSPSDQALQEFYIHHSAIFGPHLKDPSDQALDIYNEYYLTHPEPTTANINSKGPSVTQYYNKNYKKKSREFE